MIRFDRRYFPERRYRLPVRWVLWGAVAVLLFAMMMFVRTMFR
jgi:hypothetical protein